MGKVDDKALGEILDSAGIGSRNRKKIMKANGTEEAADKPATKKSKSRGHGCASPAGGPARL